MNRNVQVIEILKNVLKTEFIIPQSGLIDEDHHALQRNIALKIAKVFEYSLDDINLLIHFDNFSNYEFDHDDYVIKKVLILSLIHIDCDGDLLINITLNKKLYWYIRVFAIQSLEYIGSKENILKLKDLLVSYFSKNEDIRIAILTLINNRCIVEYLPYLKSLSLGEVKNSIVNELIFDTITKLELNA